MRLVGSNVREFITESQREQAARSNGLNAFEGNQRVCGGARSVPGRRNRREGDGGPGGADRFPSAQFFANDVQVLWGFDPHANIVRPDPHDRDDDVVPDVNPLSRFP
jgi:hypothetical protein